MINIDLLDWQPVTSRTFVYTDLSVGQHHVTTDSAIRESWTPSRNVLFVDDSWVCVYLYVSWYYRPTINTYIEVKPQSEAFANQLS